MLKSHTHTHTRARARTVHTIFNCIPMYIDRRPYISGGTPTNHCHEGTSNHWDVHYIDVRTQTTAFQMWTLSAWGFVHTYVWMYICGNTTQYSNKFSHENANNIVPGVGAVVQIDCLHPTQHIVVQGKPTQIQVPGQTN